MNIGVTSSLDFNPYAGTVIAKLLRQGHAVKCIISLKESKLSSVTQSLKHSGYIPTAVRLLRRLVKGPRPYYGVDVNSKSNLMSHLREYAESENLQGWDRPLTAISKKHGIMYHPVESINSVGAVSAVQNGEVDVLVNCGGGIFRRPIIAAPRIGILNAHMGALPQFRGMNTLEWSIFQGKTIGVTVHFIDRHIDTGDILSFRTIPMNEEDTIDVLRAKSFAVNVALLAECVDTLAGNSASRVRQDPQEGLQYFVMHPRLKELTGRRLRTAMRRRAEPLSHEA